MIEKLKYNERQTGGEDMVLRIEKIPVQPWEMQDKINELVDAVNEITDPCQDPKAYKIMKEKDEIIARHIQEKNDLQRKLDIAVSALTVIAEGLVVEHQVVGHEDDNKIFIAKHTLEQINNKE